MGIIRFLLAVCVLLWHCPPGVVPRFLFPTLAVQCFYIVSGFLIQMVLLERYRDNTGWARQFYLSRFLRIYPLYALFAVLTVACFGSELMHYLQHGELLAAVLWLENNLLIIGQDVLRFFYFDLASGHFGILPANGADRAMLLQHTSVGQMTMLPQSWTLAIEMYFYLLAPFILLRRTRMLLCVLTLSVALRFAIGAHFRSRPELVYGFFPTELALFLAGSLSYRLYKRLFEGQALRRLHSLIPASIAVLSMAAVYLNSVPDFTPERTGYTFPFLFGAWGGQPLGVPDGYWLIVLLTALVLPFAFHFSKRIAFDRYLGELSYPMYISHFLVLQLLTAKLNPPNSATPYVGLAVLLITLLLSIVLVDYCEEPLARLRHRLTSREKKSEKSCPSSRNALREGMDSRVVEIRQGYASEGEKPVPYRIVETSRGYSVQQRGWFFGVTWWTRCRKKSIAAAQQALSLIISERRKDETFWTSEPFNDPL